jgi:hypothetical protein
MKIPPLDHEAIMEEASKCNRLEYDKKTVTMTRGRKRAMKRARRTRASWRASSKKWN